MFGDVSAKWAVLLSRPFNSSRGESLLQENGLKQEEGKWGSTVNSGTLYGGSCQQKVDLLYCFWLPFSGGRLDFLGPQKILIQVFLH